MTRYQKHQGRDASWIIVRLADGVGVLETWNPAVAAAIDPARYKAVGIGEWLASLNPQKD